MIDCYDYRAAWSDEDGEYAGQCAAFPSLSWLSPRPTPPCPASAI